MDYTIEQEQVITNIADKFSTTSDRVKRLLGQYNEHDKTVTFEQATTDVINTLHDHQMDMEMDAWDYYYDIKEEMDYDE